MYTVPDLGAGHRKCSLSSAIHNSWRQSCTSPSTTRGTPTGGRGVPTQPDLGARGAFQTRGELGLAQTGNEAALRPISISMGSHVDRGVGRLTDCFSGYASYLHFRCFFLFSQFSGKKFFASFAFHLPASLAKKRTGCRSPAHAGHQVAQGLCSLASLRPEGTGWNLQVRLREGRGLSGGAELGRASRVRGGAEQAGLWGTGTVAHVSQWCPRGRRSDRGAVPVEGPSGTRATLWDKPPAGSPPPSRARCTRPLPVGPLVGPAVGWWASGLLLGSRLS